MTIKLPRDQRAVQDALKNPEGSAFFFSLAIDDLEVGDYIYEGEWGAGSSGGAGANGSGNLGAISVDLTLGTRLPRGYDDAPSAFVVTVNGVDIPQMVGLTSLPEVTEDRAGTEFLAASGLSEAARIELGDITQYPGWTPDLVIKDCFQRLPHARGYSEIDPLKNPILNFQAPNAHFLPEEKVADVLKRVQDQTPYVIRDSAWGGCVASLALEPAKEFIEDYRVYSSDDFPKWRPPPRKERRYSEVVVFRRGEDGRDAFEPQRASIYYPRQRHLPLYGASLWISLDDTTQEAPRRARNLANQMALRLGRGTFGDDSVILPFFDPLIELQDVFWVYEDWEDLAGYWSRSWLCWVDAYKHSFEELTTEVSYSAALVEEQEIKAPALAMAGLSSGVIQAVLSPCDRVGDILRFDGDRVDWVTQLGDVIYFADGAGNVSSDGDVIQIICPYGPTYEAWGEYPEGTVYFLNEVSWESSDGIISTIDEPASGGYASVSGDGLIGSLITGVKIPTPTLLWGERPPFVGFFDDSVLWNTSDGIVGTVDEAASGGIAVTSEPLYPSETLYPSENLYPGEGLYVTIS